MNCEEFLEAFLAHRGIDPDDMCRECAGSGTRAYANTSTWRGGIGGQTITAGVCDKCWGSGSKSRPWPSHREIDTLKRRTERLRSANAELLDLFEANDDGPDLHKPLGALGCLVAELKESGPREDHPDPNAWWELVSEVETFCNRAREFVTKHEGTE